MTAPGSTPARAAVEITPNSRMASGPRFGRRGGWVYHSLLSGPAPSHYHETKDESAALRERRSNQRGFRRLQAGVVAQVKKCAAGWCHVPATPRLAGSNKQRAVGRLCG